MAETEGLSGRLAGLQAVLRTPVARRILALVLLALGSTFLVMEFVRVPMRPVQVGEVVDRDIRALASFSYIDHDATSAQRLAAIDAVRPVYDYDASRGARVQARIRDAFQTARRRYADALLTARAEDRQKVDEATLSEISRDFLRHLELSLATDDLARIASRGWDEAIEDVSTELVSQTLSSYIVADPSVLPSRPQPVQVVKILLDGRDELQLNDLSHVLTLEEARKDLALRLLERTDAERADDEVKALALAVARAVLRPNFSFNQLLTEDRRRAARDGVDEVVIQVQRGTALAREGDVISRAQADQIAALQQSRTGLGLVGVAFALFGFSGLLAFALYQFGAGYIRKFSTRPQDIDALVVITILVLALGRLTVELSAPVAQMVGLGIAPSSMFFVVPFAGGAMLVRTLINSETTLFWIIGVAALMGLMMDQQVLFTLFFLVSGLTGATALGHTKERVNVLRAGLQTGLANAGAALLINLVQVHLGESGVVATGASQPLWDVGFAFTGGLLGGVLALGLVPIFEAVGFVTDFKLLELANLNHPLLRQLMLRAPGTYHHSVTVASLCESGAEAIGANALQIRVACYFHDIGKALQPKFFIENQGGGPNPHDKLPPHTSARVIINHVVDGAAIARQYKLPQPIIDGIEMHHGTGIIQYFYARAVEQADDPDSVDENDFRYPGKLPNSREAGIMMLADKVEAAVRSLKDPSADNIRNMIQKIVNASVTDGQFEQCPLTIQELYKVVDAFTSTLMGIYHQRIEYPGMPAPRSGRLAKRNPEVPAASIITLEMHNPFRADRTDPEVNVEKTDPSSDGPEVSDPGEPATQPLQAVADTDVPVDKAH